MATHTLMTAEQFDQLPVEEGRKYELLDGELIEVASATAKHNIILSTLTIDVGGYLKERKLGICFCDTEFAMGVNQRLRPDLVIMLNATWKKVDEDRLPLVIMPEIAVEIVSPSEAAVELDRKMIAYLEAGVQEVWVIYPSSRHVIMKSATAIRDLGGNARLESPLLPGWSMQVSDLFPEKEP
jgi:Uma2 family endonuclease